MRWRSPGQPNADALASGHEHASGAPWASDPSPVLRARLQLGRTGGDPEDHRGAGAAYHHFLRDGAWSSRQLWRGLALAVLGRYCPAGVPVDLVIDDSLLHRAGPLVDGADVFRDPVRSTQRRTVYARGINTVALCVLVRLPFLRQPLALTVDKRDFRKGGPAHVALAAEMVTALDALCPDHRFRLVADGAYASLADADLPRTSVVSRMRRDAALYDRAPDRRPGQHGRPRKKGARLPTPPGLAAASRSQWQKVDLRQRGRTVTRLLLSHILLWYGASGTRPLLLVIVRDPAGREPDDFFSTDLDAAPADVASLYYDRWPIEVTFRDVKQLLTPQHVQSWRRCGPGRAIALGFWLYSAVWLHYLQTCADRPSWPDRPWHPDKRSPSPTLALPCAPPSGRSAFPPTSSPTATPRNSPLLSSPFWPAPADPPTSRACDPPFPPAQPPLRSRPAASPCPRSPSLQLKEVQKST